MAECSARWCNSCPPLPSAGEGKGVRAAVSRFERGQYGVDENLFGARKFVRDSQDLPAFCAQPCIAFRIVSDDVFEPVKRAVDLDRQPLASDRKIDCEPRNRMLSAHRQAVRQAQFAENFPRPSLGGACGLAKASGAPDIGGSIHSVMSSQIESLRNHRALSPGPSPANGRGGRAVDGQHVLCGLTKEVSHG